MPNRTQSLVLAFVLVAWLSLVALFVVAQDVYLRALRLGPGDEGRGGLLALAGITLLIGFFSLGVVRRWRWLFWLILIAFLAGSARLAVSMLELTGVLSSSMPIWYSAYQGWLAVFQVVIALLMLRGYRRAGTWGAF
jgi:hypothetical protein